MILTCPSCDAQYLIPDGSIGEGGRKVKCASCAYKWVQMPVKDEEIHVEAENFEEIPEPNNDMPYESRRERFHGHDGDFSAPSAEKTISAQGVALSFLLFFTLTAAVFTSGRQVIVQNWEASAKLYNMIGLSVPVAGQGLSFDSVSAKLSKNEQGQPVLIVKGRIDNISDYNVALPALKIRSYDGNEWLKDWMIPLGGKIMQRGQSIAFDYQLSDLPKGYKKAIVTFTY